MVYIGINVFMSTYAEIYNNAISGINHSNTVQYINKMGKLW